MIQQDKTTRKRANKELFFFINSIGRSFFEFKKILYKYVIKNAISIASPVDRVIYKYTIDNEASNAHFLLFVS